MAILTKITVSKTINLPITKDFTMTINMTITTPATITKIDNGIDFEGDSDLEYKKNL